MSATKSRHYYERTRDQHQALFTEFKDIHDQYKIDPAAMESKFNSVGLQVMDLLRATERQLCAGMERGGYGAYSSKLAEKYWEIVKAEYPLIELVGVRRRIVTKAS